MKKLLTLVVMFLMVTAVLAADKVKTVFTLDHQMSEMCEKKIKSNLRYEKGVKDIDVSLKDNTITITYLDDKTDSENLLKAFKKIGFNAFVVDADGNIVNPSAKAEGGCCGGHGEGCNNCGNCGHCEK